MKKKDQTLKHKDFIGSVDFSIEDGILFGKLLFINDLITYEAETLTGLKAEFKAAVEDYIETCKQLDREPKKPCSGTLNVRIGPELHQQAAEYAVENGIRINEVIKLSMTKFFEPAKKQEIVLNHIHKHEMVSTQEFSFSPSIENKAGANYELTTFIQ